jgi:Na+/H+ antiporter
MGAVELGVIVLSVAAALRLVARRIGVPHPVLLVFGGLALAFVPGLPRITIAPGTLFLIFIPPLLFWAAFTASLRDARRQFNPIARLATLVVLLTTAIVAVLAHALTPAFTWAAAFTLGAIVSPPDPVAAIAVLRPLGARRRVVTILEGEGLVNDATALVAYQIAVGAAVTGVFVPWRAGLRFLLAGMGGVAIGLAVGWLIALARRRLGGRSPIVENTLSLLTPYFAYLPAAWLDLSGVLAVVAVGLYLGRKGPRLVAGATRVQAESMWTMVQFVLESLIFSLIGLELPVVLRALRSHSLALLVEYGALITLAIIVTRLIYTFAAVFLLRHARRRRGKHPEPPWSEGAFIGWTGMRGGDSLVIALALPFTTAVGAPFPARDLIVLLTFAVILGTLVIQGLTVVPALHLLHLTGDREDRSEEAHARRVAAEVGLRRLEEVARQGGVDPGALGDIRSKYGKSLRQWATRDRHQHGALDADHRGLSAVDGEGAERYAASYRSLRTAMIAAERRAIIDLRDRGTIGDDVMRRVQRELDLETMLLESADDDAPESPYDVP